MELFGTLAIFCSSRGHNRMDLNDLVYSNHGKCDPQIDFNDDNLDQLKRCGARLTRHMYETNLL